MLTKYCSPYVVYKGKIAIKDRALYFIRNRKDKILFSKEVIKRKVEKGEMTRVKDSEKYGKCGLLDYDSLRPTVKMRLKFQYGFPPKIVNE